MNKHTPGEWQIEDGNFVYVLDAESGTNRFWAGISAGYIGTGARTSTEEIYANARLIAAAPDLLVALRAMLAIVSQTGIASGICCCGDDMNQHENPFNCGHVAVDSGHYHSGPLLECARAAITKATGETK
jgi:hypothetical protein